MINGRLLIEGSGSAWSLKNPAYISFKETNTGTYGNGRALFFSSDGNKMFFTHTSGEQTRIEKWTLYSAWDITTATASQSYTTSTFIANAFYFKPDGTRLLFGDNTRKLHAYTLSTAWDLTTLTDYVVSSASNFTYGTKGIWVKDDGFRIILVGTNSQGAAPYFYTVDINSAWGDNGIYENYVAQLNATSLSTQVNDLILSPDGKRLISIENSNKRFQSWNLPTAYSVGGMQYDTDYVYSSFPDFTASTGLYISPDGLNMYVYRSEYQSCKVYRFSL